MKTPTKSKINTQKVRRRGGAGPNNSISIANELREIRAQLSEIRSIVSNKGYTSSTQSESQYSEQAPAISARETRKRSPGFGRWNKFLDDYVAEQARKGIYLRKDNVKSDPNVRARYYALNGRKAPERQSKKVASLITPPSVASSNSNTNSNTSSRTSLTSANTNAASASEEKKPNIFEDTFNSLFTPPPAKQTSPGPASATQPIVPPPIKEPTPPSQNANIQISRESNVSVPLTPKEGRKPNTSNTNTVVQPILPQQSRSNSKMPAVVRKPLNMNSIVSQERSPRRMTTPLRNSSNAAYYGYEDEGMRENGFRRIRLRDPKDGEMKDYFLGNDLALVRRNGNEYARNDENEILWVGYLKPGGEIEETASPF